MNNRDYDMDVALQGQDVLDPQAPLPCFIPPLYAAHYLKMYHSRSVFGPEYRWVARTWAERLFSWPWRPCRRQKTEEIPRPPRATQDKVRIRSRPNVAIGTYPPEADHG